MTGSYRPGGSDCPRSGLLVGAECGPISKIS